MLVRHVVRGAIASALFATMQHAGARVLQQCNGRDNALQNIAQTSRANRSREKNLSRS
jgi:hypothetical protein